MIAVRDATRAPELFFTESSITYDAAHRECVDGIVPGNGDDSNTVGHHDVLALPGAEIRLSAEPGQHPDGSHPECAARFTG